MAIASVTLLLLSPVMLVIALMLAANNRGTPFFVQNRPGKNGKIFSIIKFKTMNNKKDAQGVLLPDYRRLTFMGKIVRKTSLDELPQLINVVKGDMSLVGPTFASRIFATLQCRAGEKTRCETRDYRMGTGEWSKCIILGREIRL